MRYPGAEWRPISINFRRGGNTPKFMIVHIMQGTLAGTNSWFRNPAAQVSAHFGVGKDGIVIQWVDTSDTAWHAVEANDCSIGVEHEGDSGEALTAAQVEADAKLLAWATEHHAIPMSLARSPEGSGLAYHAMGAARWGGHLQCPGQPVVAQLPKIIALAMSIRQGGETGPKRWTAAGQLSLHNLAAQHMGEDVTAVLATTARNSPGAALSSDLARYVNTVFAADSTRCPAGITWHYPGKAGQATSWLTHGDLSLSALAAKLGTLPARIIEVTADVAGTQPVQALAASYIDSVFAASSLHVPAGVVLMYGTTA